MSMCWSCSDPLASSEEMRCNGDCGGAFHFRCVNIAESNYKKMNLVYWKKWKCSDCKRGDLSKEIGELSDKIDIIHNLNSNMAELKKSIDFMSSQFDTFVGEIKEVKQTVDVLIQDNKKLKAVVEILRMKVDGIQQDARGTNIEILGIPESTKENCIGIAQHVTRAPGLVAPQKTKESVGTGASIRSYTLHLAADKTSVFAQTIDNFVSCTKESKEARPQIVMRNMRQFMTGMTHYLKVVPELNSTLFLDENSDAILEGVMHELVVIPLKEHLYKLFVDEYTDSGAIQLLQDNIKYARTKHPQDIGVRPNIVLPSGKAMYEICSYLKLLEEIGSPLEKLEILLKASASLIEAVEESNSKGGLLLDVGADDFLPLFVWVLVQSDMVAAEIEADYMSGLLHDSVLSAKGGYCLATLSSAVQVIKNRAFSDEYTASGTSLNRGPESGPLVEFRSVLKIVVPDERNGSILTKTLPIWPNMTTKDVCKIIANKVRITNPQDYALYKLIDGEETILADSECPQDIKGNLSDTGKHCMFAYKRIDSKIAWPKNTSQ